MKRVLEFVLAAVGLVITAPLVVAAAVAVRLESPGPVIYSGPRVGLHGRPFRIHKIRTMRASDGGANVTAGDDPRITRVGRFLRRTRLDELPQLYNVLVGEMSLVGPRPEDPKYVAMYTPQQRKVLDVRPGITGPAALAFLNEEELLRGGDAESVYVTSVMPRKLAIDLDYVSHASVGGDLRIMAGTVARMVGRALTRGSG